MRNGLPIVMFIIWLCHVPTSSFSQSVNIDSLRRVISNAAADSITIEKYIDFANKLDTDDDMPYEIVLSWALAASKKINNEALIARVYYTYGTTYLLDDNEAHAKSVGYFNKALLIAEAKNYTDLQAYIYNNLTHIYGLNGQWDKAIEFCRQSVFYSEKAKLKNLIGSNYSYFSHGFMEKYYKDKNTAFLDSAIHYTKLGIEYAKTSESKSPLITLNLNLVKQLLQRGNITEARQYLSDAGKLIKTTGKLINYSTYYGREADLFIAEKKTDSAIASIERGIQNAVQFRKTERQNELESTLASIYKQTGDYKKALFYTEKTKAYYDSVRNKENFSKAADIQNKYERERKDNEIKRLNDAERIKQLELEKQKAIIAGNLLEAEKKENEIMRLNDAERIKQLELEKQKAIIAGNMLEAKRKQDEIILLSQEKELQGLQIIKQTDELSKNALQAKADSQQIQLSRQQAISKEKEISIQKKTRNYLIGGVAALCLLAFFLLKNIRAKKKAYSSLQDKSEQIKEQALQLSKQAKQIAQFQSQMNPHFVYNALHNIQGLVLTDEKQKANTQIQSLAQLMRKTFANAEKDDIPVEEEINYLHKYIDFEKNAFGKNLNFEVSVAKEAEGTLIPPMMIQPFIENAIKHAELNKVENPYIKVLIEIENNLLAIQIKDNGVGIRKDLSETDKLSHSMSVIKSRLDLIFRGRSDVNHQPVFSIKTVPEIKEGTNVKFYLPLTYSY